ncbi:hypothetical protein NFI95_03700 [Acetobacteraceae bacterium KSS8]|uniref:Uncharacterized protein n=1 Tax=Endosaccharibacter trunci TaxID=2812733 RepID=A0ABT1W3U9_9PROT|nr:hypothetical protein [Acetobacteraceae bacterium KSS8]
MKYLNIAGLCLLLAGTAAASIPARAAGYAHWGPNGVVVAHGTPGWHGRCCYGFGAGVGLGVGVAAGAALATAARPPVPYYGYPAVYAAPPVIYAAPTVVYTPGYAYVR